MRRPASCGPKTSARRRDRVAAEVVNWEEKAKLAVSKGRDDLAKAALQERRAVEESLRIIEEELTSSVSTLRN